MLNIRKATSPARLGGMLQGYEYSLGSLMPEGEENPYLVNAGGQHVSLVPGGSIVHHADAFAIVRSGLLDVSVMGSYEVSESGDFANWRTSGRKGGGIGGAMDLALGRRRERHRRSQGPRYPHQERHHRHRHR